MELTPVIPAAVRRFCPASQPAERTPGKTASGPRETGDRLRISQLTAGYLQEQSRLTQEVAKIIQRFMAEREQKEGQGKTEADAMAERLKVMERCHKIAARIMAGDKVPPQDMQYLAENDSLGYKMAMAGRMLSKEKPKEWESVLEDDEKEAGASGGSGASSGAAESGGGTEASGGAAESAAE